MEREKCGKRCRFVLTERLFPPDKNRAPPNGFVLKELETNGRLKDKQR